jgi:SpoIID/LytB domain protein
MKIWFWNISYTALTAFCLLGLTGASGPVTDNNSEIELRIGIVQRFGDKLKEQLLLEPTKGDRLKITFKAPEGEKTVVTNKAVKLETVMQPLSQPIVEERVVLGTYRTYETAEDTARGWRKLGIEVEIAQPERWQIWAKRDVYNTPLLRRLLVESLKAAGKSQVYIDSKILREIPRVSWVVDGNRYTRAALKISSDKNLIKVNEGTKPETSFLYPGRLELQSNAYDSFTLINEVPLETYLRGVVPYEIGTQAPLASMEAQAIIARTYVLRNLHRFAIDGYQLCADTHCQVYQGLSGASPITDKAIQATKGKVVTYKNELVDALYSSTTGGMTASFSDVWNGEDRPYLKPVLDAPKKVLPIPQNGLANEEMFKKFITQEQGFNESRWDLFRWRKESSLEDITKGLQKFLKVKNSPFSKFKTLRDMKIVERSPSGRILEMAITTDIGTFSLHKDEVRSAFFAPKSSFYYIQPVSKGKDSNWGYAFVGGGLGHGVGLSQTGAQNLAKLGWSSSKILQFYYPGTQLQALNSSIKK